MFVRVVIVAIVTVLVFAGCGDDATQVPAGAPTDDTIYAVTATVLQAPGQEPQLCLGGVATSLPPQCGGPEIVNWDWEEAPTKETRSGVTWGDYLVAGTFDGERFTLTEPPQAPEVSSQMSSVDFTSPCEEPPGGWHVADATKATDEALSTTLEAVNADPEFAGAWIDQNGRENDPERMVLNLRFTADLDRHEREVRETWGGALCVTEAEHSLQELEEIKDELSTLDTLSVDADDVRNVVVLTVILDRDGELQREMDQRYGEGVVEVESALKPVE
jgi:hypothetical protein